MQELLKTSIFSVVKREAIPGHPNFKPIAVVAPDWVMIVVERGGKFLMECQQRYGIQRMCTEFPCGTLEAGETPVQAAARELAEETGIVVDVSDLTLLLSGSANPAFMTNSMHFFYINLDKVQYSKQPVKFDEDEDLVTAWRDKQEVKEALFKDPYVALSTVACLGILTKAGLLQ